MRCPESPSKIRWSPAGPCVVLSVRPGPGVPAPPPAARGLRSSRVARRALIGCRPGGCFVSPLPIGRRRGCRCKRGGHWRRRSMASEDGSWRVSGRGAGAGPGIGLGPGGAAGLGSARPYPSAAAAVVRGLLGGVEALPRAAPRLPPLLRARGAAGLRPLAGGLRGLPRLGEGPRRRRAGTAPPRLLPGQQPAGPGEGLQKRAGLSSNPLKHPGSIVSFQMLKLLISVTLTFPS